MGTPPAFVDEHECANWKSTGASKASTFNVNAGDTLLVLAGNADNGCRVTGCSSTGATVDAWNHAVAADGWSNYGGAHAWVANVTSTASITVTLTASNTSDWWGYNILRYTGVTGVGGLASDHVLSGAPTLNITTSGANSVVGVINMDWNNVDGASRTWRTNAGAFTEQTYVRQAGGITAYAGFHADSGATNTYAVGLSAPTGQKYVIVAIELLGTSSSSASPVAGQAGGTNAAASPTASVRPSDGQAGGTNASADPTVKISSNPSAGVSTATAGTATPQVRVAASAGAALVVAGTASPSASVAPAGGSASVTAGSAGPSTGIGSSPGSATVQAGPSGPGDQVTTSAGLAGSVSAPAQAAGGVSLYAGSGSAQSAVTDPRSTVVVGAQSATAASGTSGTSPSERANAGSAPVQTSALDATVAITGMTDAYAENASAGAAPVNAGPQVRASAGLAAPFAALADATVFLPPVTTAPAGCAEAVAESVTGSTLVAVSAGVSAVQVDGLAPVPSVGGQAGSADAGLADVSPTVDISGTDVVAHAQLAIAVAASAGGIAAVSVMPGSADVIAAGLGAGTSPVPGVLGITGDGSAMSVRGDPDVQSIGGTNDQMTVTGDQEVMEGP